MNTIAEHEFEREARRIIRRLIEPQSFVAATGEDEFTLYVAADRWKKPVMRIAGRIWLAIERRDLVGHRQHPEREGETVWQLNETGRAYWRRLEPGADPFRAQHQLHATRIVVHDGVSQRAEVNESETPLAWLRRRKGADGKPLISDIQLEAGERLRRDFTLSALSARVTTNWSLNPGGNPNTGRRFDPSDVTDMALSARTRFAQALDAVGSGLSGILTEVCCNHRGLEDIERSFGWPQRSGKVVLQIALDRLAEHYQKGGRSRRRRAERQPAAASAAAASDFTRSTIE
tara:strand:- start:9838 stop:10704 length:867 start_codon:yes stop_codon:yes gene_type:complete